MSLGDLHMHRGGPEAWGCANHIKTDIPRDITDLYYMGYTALTMHIWHSNYSVGHKRFKGIPSNSASHHRRQMSIESDSIHQWSWVDAIFWQILSLSLTLRTTALLSLCRKCRLHSRYVDFKSKKSLLQLLFFQLLTMHPIAPSTINVVRPIH